MTASVVFILRYFKKKQTVIWSKNSSSFFFSWFELQDNKTRDTAYLYFKSFCCLNKRFCSKIRGAVCTRDSQRTYY